MGLRKKPFHQRNLEMTKSQKSPCSARKAPPITPGRCMQDGKRTAAYEKIRKEGYRYEGHWWHIKKKRGEDRWEWHPGKPKHKANRRRTPVKKTKTKTKKKTPNRRRTPVKKSKTKKKKTPNRRRTPSGNKRRTNPYDLYKKSSTNAGKSPTKLARDWDKLTSHQYWVKLARDEDKKKGLTPRTANRRRTPVKKTKTKKKTPNRRRTPVKKTKTKKKKTPNRRRTPVKKTRPDQTRPD